MSRLLPALAVPALTLGFAPVADAALRTARFDATLTGTQTTTWSMERAEPDGCTGGEMRFTGSGTEALTFRTARPIRIRAVAVGRDVVFSAAAGLPVRGTIERSGHLTTTSDGESWCGGTENPTAPPAPDCGTRSWQGVVTPIVEEPGVVDELIDGAGPALFFTGPSLADGRAPGDLFEACAAAGGDQINPTSNSRVDAARLFGERRRIVIRGRDRAITDEVGLRKTTTVAWRLVLVRRAVRTTRAPTPTAPSASAQRERGGEHRE